MEQRIKTILIIDDEEELLELTRTFLKRHGYSVITSRGEGDILAMVKRLSPALIILDQLLLTQDGLDICHDLKTDPVTASIPVLMTSGQVAIEEQLPEELHSPDGFLIKPFDIDDLLTKIQSLLE